MRGDGMRGPVAGSGSSYVGKRSTKLFPIECGLKKP